MTHTGPDAEHLAQFVSDVRAGLGGAGQKTLSPKYFYDALGSALFEAICRLDEYGLSRAGERLLVQHARELPHHVRGVLRIVELGGGSGRKLRLLLEGLAGVEVAGCAGVDVSPAALEAMRDELDELPGVRFEGIVDTFLDGLTTAASRRAAGQRLVVLFLGSNLGNSTSAEADRLLAGVRARLVTGDTLMLGLDLAGDERTLLRAYDDPLGVTAAFDKNVLARMNRELGANFDLARFDHEARWSARERRVEMHLRSRGAQRVEIPAAGIVVHFADGETLWTESSHKYVLAELPALGSRAGFELSAHWVDERWPFVHALFTAR